MIQRNHQLAVWIHELVVLGRLSDGPGACFEPNIPNLKLFRRGAVLATCSPVTLSSFSSSGGVGGKGGVSSTSGIGVIDSVALGGGVGILCWESDEAACALRLPIDYEPR